MFHRWSSSHRTHTRSSDANLAAGVPSAGGGDSDEFVSVEVLESMIGSVVSLVVVHVTDLQIRLEHFSATTGAVARNLPCFVCVCVCVCFFLGFVDDNMASLFLRFRCQCPPPIRLSFRLSIPLSQGGRTRSCSRVTSCTAPI